MLREQSLVGGDYWLSRFQSSADQLASSFRSAYKLYNHIDIVRHQRIDSTIECRTQEIHLGPWATAGYSSDLECVIGAGVKMCAKLAHQCQQALSDRPQSSDSQSHGAFSSQRTTGGEGSSDSSLPPECSRSNSIRRVPSVRTPKGLNQEIRGLGVQATPAIDSPLRRFMERRACLGRGLLQEPLRSDETRKRATVV